MPFTKKFEGNSRDIDLEEKLKIDAEYVLKWLADGAYQYFKHGLYEPEIVKSTTDKYCIEADSVKSFLENATVNEKGYLVKSSSLHQAYVDYCKSSSYEPLDNKSFSQTLTKKGVEKRFKNSGTFFKDIRLLG